MSVVLAADMQCHGQCAVGYIRDSSGCPWVDSRRQTVEDSVQESHSVLAYHLMVCSDPEDTQPVTA